MATAEGLRGRVETLQGAAAEVKCQLEQQSTQLSSQVAELGSTRLKLQESQVSSHVFAYLGSHADLPTTVRKCGTRDVLYRRLSNYSAEC